MLTRKVLIISYLWPPMEGVGLMRALKFARYLPDYGWQPVILTAKTDGNIKGKERDNLYGMTVYRTEYKDRINELKKLLFIPSTVLRGLTISDEQIGWYEFAVEDGVRLMSEEKIDLIFSTSPPETAHLIARELKKRCNVPWVADLRDLWSEDHYRKRSRLKKIFLKSREKKVLNDADFLLTVSKPWVDTLNSALGGDKKVAVIENGFDEADFKDVSIRKNEKFTITYTGKLHKDNQPIDGFFKALKDLIEAGSIDRERIEVKFYILGYERPDIEGMAGDYGLEGVVKESGKVGYERSLEIQRASDVLLFIQWQGTGSEGWYSAKLYDYLGARRPILGVAKKVSIIGDLINRTSSGVVALGEEDLKKNILLLYDEFIKNGFVSYRGKEEEVLKNTRLARTAELADIFKSVLKGF